MEKKYISVHALNQYIKAKFNQDIQLQNIYIQGEISNYRPHPSGHLYFTLKDDTSRISAVMFASNAKKLDFRLENGMKVFIQAKVSVYDVTGQYQLYIHSIQPDGIGNLYLQYEKLKEKLYLEGLFDEKYKKTIPHIPRHIAVLSAKQGAAVWDVIKTISQRAPFVKTVIFPIPVQGQNAYLNIIETLKKVDQIGFDVMIIARGGGSLEDLMNFNNEMLARTIFSLKTPIISGIGHETDFTICDFVCDKRAVTPTGAALIATPDINEMKQYHLYLKKRLISFVSKKIDFEKNRINRLSHSYFFSNPDQIYANQLIMTNHLQQRLAYCFKTLCVTQKNNQKNIINKLLIAHKMYLSYQTHNLHIMVQQLDGLSPLKILSRGYNIIYKDNDMIKTIDDLEKNDDITIKMYDGEIEARIKQVRK